MNIADADCSTISTSDTAIATIASMPLKQVQCSPHKTKTANINRSVRPPEARLRLIDMPTEINRMIWNLTKPEGVYFGVSNCKLFFNLPYEIRKNILQMASLGDMSLKRWQDPYDP